MNPNYNNDAKNEVRNRLVNFFRPNSKVGLFFPSKQAIDVNQCLKAKKVNRQTKMIFIENDNQVLQNHVKPFAKQNFTNYYIHNDDAESLNLKTITKQFGKIDTAFFDFCGPLDNQCALWLENIQDCLTDNARIGFTFNLAYQNSPLLVAQENIPDNECLHSEAVMEPTYNYCVSDNLSSVMFDDNGDLLVKWGYVNTIHILCRIFKYSLKIQYTQEYQSNRNPMLFIMAEKQKQHIDRKEVNYSIFDDPYFTFFKFGPPKTKIKLHTNGIIANTSHDTSYIINKFKKAKTIHALAGAKRSLTEYAKRRSQQEGKPIQGFIAAVKAQLTANGINL